MLRLRSCVLTHIVSSPATYPAKHPVYSLHGLLSTAAPAAAVSTGPRFAAEKYLADTCGLTRAQALKASAKLSHLKYPSRPDAVLAFLAGIGLSSADVAATVARDPSCSAPTWARPWPPSLPGPPASVSRARTPRVPAGVRPRWWFQFFQDVPL